MIRIQLEADVPLTDQLVTEIRGAIARGEVQPGDPLPSVRQLAGDLGINLNTVSRAYRLLEECGLVSTHRGRGTRVTAAREAHPALDDRSLRNRARALLADARLAALPRELVAALLHEELDTLWSKEESS
ncbi:MAG: GntR family transcriptional regulator [Planctomycetota bacterium]|nr:MAG: GntR family transcriptional regulator [Planctomycetota bacterium]